MQVTHAGYKDPNNLMFENIIVLGVPHPPVSVSVTHVNPGTHENTTTAVPNTNIEYNRAKKVNTHMFIAHAQIQNKNSDHSFFSCQGK